MDGNLDSKGSSAQSSGYEVAKAATHWMDGKKMRPILVLVNRPMSQHDLFFFALVDSKGTYLGSNPKAPRTWLKVTSLENSQAFMRK